MKTKLIKSMKVLLVAAGLGAGAMNAWGAYTYLSSITGRVGSTDFSSNAFEKASKPLLLDDGDSFTYTFNNYNGGTGNFYNNWILEVHDGTGCFDLRADGHNWTWGEGFAITSYSGNSYTNISSDATSWLKAYNGVTVTLTVSRSGNTITATHTATTKAVDTADDGEDDIASQTYTGTLTVNYTGGNTPNVYITNEKSYQDIGKMVVTKGTVTTTTYDFQSMGSTSLTQSSNGTGRINKASSYSANELAAMLDGISLAWGVSSSITIDATDGIKHTNTVNTGRSSGFRANTSYGSKVVATFNNKVTACAYPDASTAHSGLLSTDGVSITNGAAITSGAIYYTNKGTDGSSNDHVVEAIFMKLSHEGTIQNLTITYNSNADYLRLFALWDEAGKNYTNEIYSEGKPALKTVMDSALEVLENEDATSSDYANAYTSLREANEYFIAINTLNTTYRVTASSVMSDGTNVKSVYGITAVYHGTWSWTTARNGNAQAATDPIASANLTHNIPNGGEYIELKPTVGGLLTLKFAWYSGSTYRVVDENGHYVYNFKKSVSNDYENYYEAGYLFAGKTYYVYKAGGSNGYQFGGFTFTPSDNTNTSYFANDGEIIIGGYSINSVPGITMTYGGTPSDVWSFDNSRVGAYLTDDATTTGTVPTSNTYVVFTPSANGKLTIDNYFYLGNGNCHLYLSDGTNVEDKGFSKGSGSNGSYSNSFSTILKAGDTYYVYFNDGYGTARFQGFSFTPTPASVPATIGGTGFATFSSAYPLDFSATSMRAYSASLTNENTVLLSPVTAVPANIGILLKGATEAIPVKAGFVNAPATNLFKPSTDEDIAASVEGTYHYVLANGSNGVGFYNLASAKNIGTGKAYLETTEALTAESGAGNARAMWVFADDETTGINAVSGECGKGNGEYYNLNGQRVTALQKGLYIVNGKKVIKK